MVGDGALASTSTGVRAKIMQELFGQERARAGLAVGEDAVTLG
jgi:hypothetical protein